MTAEGTPAGTIARAAAVRCDQCSGVHDLLGVSHDESRRIASWTNAYWQLLARTKPPRFWTTPAWNGRMRLGDDERGRSTLAWGRWCVALWWCRCDDCRRDVATLRQRVDREP